MFLNTVVRQCKLQQSILSVGSDRNPNLWEIALKTITEIESHCQYNAKSSLLMPD